MHNHFPKYRYFIINCIVILIKKCNNPRSKSVDTRYLSIIFRNQNAGDIAFECYRHMTLHLMTS